MKLKTIIVATMCVFLLLLLPNVNAIQSTEVDKDLVNKIENRINFFQKRLNVFNNVDLTNPGILKILLIFYVIGYFAFLPFAWFLVIGSNPYGDLSFLEILIRTILCSFLWPIIVFDIIRAYIEGLSDVNYC